MKMPKIRMPKSFRRKSKGEIALHLFVSLIFFLVAASYVYVFVWAVIAGTKTHTEIIMDPFGLPATWDWGHYLDVFSLLEVNGNNFFDMLFNSVYFSVGAVGLAQLTTMSFASAHSSEQDHRIHRHRLHRNVITKSGIECLPRQEKISISVHFRMVQRRCLRWLSGTERLLKCARSIPLAIG